MFGEISLLVVLQAAALIAAGSAAGYFLALQRFDKQRDKLRDELENTRNELKEHREQVDSHFLKTGLLFNRLTNNYREIYEHLATGAQNLCSPQIDKPQLDQPESRVLPAAVATTAAVSSIPAGEEDSELAATHSPHPDVETAINTQANESAENRAHELPVEETMDADPAPTAATENQSAAAEASADALDQPEGQASASTVSAHDENPADDEHLGADAAPAPTLAPKTIISDLPPATESSPPVDQHKSPPSIH